jgi:methionyl-tRNA formyltransferase
MKAGYTINGVMSEDPQVVSWARQQGLIWTNDFEIFKSTLLEEKSFDYLFSIFNKQYILPKAILHKPKQFTINCHDGPLPKYAGANATVWAILNGEQSHGITWHVVSEKLDAGDILKQAIFPIDRDETALSLNLKCYEHARLSFIKLVDEISNNKIARVKQDLQKRSYYNSYNKPRGNALIQWNSAAEEIDRIYRALNFGEYCNPMALPKFVFGSQAIIPQSLIIVDQVSTQLPGTIVEIGTDNIEIATSTQNIILKKFIDLLGQPIDIQTLSTVSNMHPGCILPSYNSASIQTIDEASLKFARHESFWVKKFSYTTEPIEKPFIIQNGTRHHYASPSIAFNCSDKFKYLASGASPEVIVLTILLIYLYRISNHQNLILYFSNRTFKGFSAPSEIIFSDCVPLSTSFTAEINFKDALQQILKELNNLEKHQTYTKDIFSRYSALKNCHTLHWGIDIADDLDNYQGNPRSSITIAINHRGDKFRVFSNGALLYDNPDILTSTITTHLHCLASSIIENINEPIAYLNFIPSDELSKMLVEWNNTNTEFPCNKTIVQIFEEQTLKNPHRRSGHGCLRARGSCVVPEGH